MRLLLMAFAIFVVNGAVVAEEIRPGVMRTPDSQFENLKGSISRRIIPKLKACGFTMLMRAKKTDSRSYCFMVSRLGAICSAI